MLSFDLRREKDAVLAMVTRLIHIRLSPSLMVDAPASCTGRQACSGVPQGVWCHVEIV